MIDIESERLISLAEAAAALPCGRKGRGPDVKTVYSWTTNGLQGIVLESVQVGGRRCTSQEAVRRFIQALTAGSGTPSQPSGNRSDAVRQEVLAAELDRLGVR